MILKGIAMLVAVSRSWLVIELVCYRKEVFRRYRSRHLNVGYDGELLLAKKL